MKPDAQVFVEALHADQDLKAVVGEEIYFSQPRIPVQYPRVIVKGITGLSSEPLSHRRKKVRKVIQIDIFANTGKDAADIGLLIQSCIEGDNPVLVDNCIKLVTLTGEVDLTPPGEKHQKSLRVAYWKIETIGG